MGAKGKLDTGLKFAYAIYIILQSCNLSMATSLGLFGYDNLIFKILYNEIYTSDIGASSTLFFTSFFMINFYIAKCEIDNLYFTEDKRIQMVIRKRTIINKLLV